MKKTFITAIISLSLIYILFLRANLNEKLEERNIPKLNGYESIIGIEEGSFFNSWFYAAVKVNEIQSKAFATELSKDADNKISFDSKYVYTIEEYKAFIKETDRNPQQFKLKRKSIDWWKTETVKKGYYFEKSLPNSCAYEVLIDQETNILYIFWHYS